MFNDDYEDETLSTEENNDSGKNFKLIRFVLRFRIMIGDYYEI